MPLARPGRGRSRRRLARFQGLLPPFMGMALPLLFRKPSVVTVTPTGPAASSALINVDASVRLHASSTTPRHISVPTHYTPTSMHSDTPSTPRSSHRPKIYYVFDGSELQPNGMWRYLPMIADIIRVLTFGMLFWFILWNMWVFTGIIARTGPGGSGMHRSVYIALIRWNSINNNQDKQGSTTGPPSKFNQCRRQNLCSSESTYRRFITDNYWTCCCA
jgi:hypothetical protein